MSLRRVYENDIAIEINISRFSSNFKSGDLSLKDKRKGDISKQFVSENMDDVTGNPTTTCREPAETFIVIHINVQCR